MSLWSIHQSVLKNASVCLLLLCSVSHCWSVVFAGEPTGVPASFLELSQEYCLDCHTGQDAEARLDLQSLSSQPLAATFVDWRRVSRVLREGSMPPADGMPLPASQRQAMLAGIDRALQHTLDANAHDPGPTVVRRLTSAEYDYCIEDLTGLQLQLGQQFVSDSVGGSGFTNSAAAQFMQDATLERYLESAKRVAEHAMIGSGPLYFFESPGRTGLELSAANRIQQIYRKHGFRAAAGEGAEPYGLQRFQTAFQVAWQYRFREQLGLASASLEQLAATSELEAKFAEHIWKILNRSEPRFPLSDIVAQWQAFPSPQQLPEVTKQNIPPEIVTAAAELYDRMQMWQNRFAGSASAEEEASVLAGENIDVPEQAQFVARALRKRKTNQDEFTPDLNNARIYSEDGRIRFKLSVEAASRDLGPQPVVIFSHPQFRFRVIDVVQPDPLPLESVLEPTAIAGLEFGKNPSGEKISASDFVIRVGESRTLEIELPADCRLGELLIDARLDTLLGRDCVVRCIVEDVTSENGRSFSSLLRDPKSAQMDAWVEGLEEFASALPQISHREPNPSDRDPIPPPFNNTYNLPDRNYFHTAVKYHRDDRFLCENILSDSVAHELDLAWSDLLTSFDYHDVNLRFICKKFSIDLPAESFAQLTAAQVQAVDGIPGQHIQRLFNELQAMQALRADAESQHLQDVLDLATVAWRRPLQAAEVKDLRRFYEGCRTELEMSHAAAIRASIVRTLVSPDFLFRVEQTPPQGIRRLNSYELASRLSFSLWASQPDGELRRLAAEDALQDADVLQAQVQRMLRSAKVERLSTEFFGQWLGFYQFDRFRGVDVKRFPEFDDALKQSLYDEAIQLFAHIVRQDRPYREILNANYTFVDRRAAEHYGIPWEQTAETPIKLSDVSLLHRGGVFGLGAILTSTSAPLRTSPVKRGDWILRRILGTPVPPPPADAGSIPAEEVLADGKTVRQRLEAHRNQAACMNCHVRIDPLGFTLENYDSLGRWRETYADGQAIDAGGVLASGQTIAGLEGLQSHLAECDEQFRRTFATNLVAYVLGRAETVHDAALIERIMQQWELDPSISTAILTLVRSPQFQMIRGDDY